ncbi:hypothetical protein [Sinorhizobium meliloti]|uniref:hypothetical protein n=1 Tax=Rhizobium meliloti TaxID=382 RepID=UPI0013922DCF|nr:hypothetical protein [Sinorhizobium meliloti]MCK3803133.1 hypothetical protein [Sinorhizobium meliloti]MCK3808905.1 hypothetical protein [Sinorhizobium meliloti]MCK3816424.1 hypothetical protein [Sinorhizobium meliloti]MDE3822994.1 hypothetical protein [Sinorhizobium meliloti]QND30402.1 hypothetical protein HB773_30785 [Sinorhizobium meliloti]
MALLFSVVRLGKQLADQFDEQGHGRALGELLAEDDCRVPAAAPGASAADRSQWNHV